MINAKEAAIAASKYILDILGSTPQGLRIEEVDKIVEDDKPYWLITLGYFEATNPYGSFNLEKTYKQFKIDSDSGEVLSMKMFTAK